MQAGPATQAHVQAAVTAPSTAFTLEEGFFDSILPPSPSLDNLLNQGIVGNAEGRKNSNHPNRLSSIFSNGRSLSTMGSLDFNWLQENPGNAWPASNVDTTTGGLQRQKSAAEVVMGSAEDYISSLSPLPAAPALRVPGQDSTVQTQMQAQAQAQMQAQAAYLASLQAASQTQASVWSSSSPSPSVMFPTPYDSGIGTSAPLSPLSSVGLATERDPMFIPVNGIAQQPSFGATLPSGGASYSRADAMAQWAQEKALMQALSSSDMNAAVQAMSGALGACAFPNGAYNNQNACPFQVQIANKPTVYVAQTQPVKVSYPSSP